MTMKGMLWAPWAGDDRDNDHQDNEMAVECEVINEGPKAETARVRSEEVREAAVQRARETRLESRNDRDSIAMKKGTLSRIAKS